MGERIELNDAFIEARDAAKASSRAVDIDLSRLGGVAGRRLLDPWNVFMADADADSLHPDGGPNALWLPGGDRPEANEPARASASAGGVAPSPEQKAPVAVNDKVAVPRPYVVRGIDARTYTLALRRPLSGSVTLLGSVFWDPASIVSQDAAGGPAPETPAPRDELQAVVALDEGLLVRSAAAGTVCFSLHGADAGTYALTNSPALNGSIAQRRSATWAGSAGWRWLDARQGAAGMMPEALKSAVPAAEFRHFSLQAHGAAAAAPEAITRAGVTPQRDDIAFPLLAEGVDVFEVQPDALGDWPDGLRGSVDR